MVLYEPQKVSDPFLKVFNHLGVSVHLESGNVLDDDLFPLLGSRIDDVLKDISLVDVQVCPPLKGFKIGLRVGVEG